MVPGNFIGYLRNLYEVSSNSSADLESPYPRVQLPVQNMASWSPARSLCSPLCRPSCAGGRRSRPLCVLSMLRWLLTLMSRCR